MKKVFSIVAVLLTAGCASAPKSLNQVTENPQTVQESIVMVTPAVQGPENGMGSSPRLKLLKAPPKRVALVSFAVLSPQYSGNDSTSTLTDTGAKQVVNNLHEKSIATMKAAFKKNGMTLLEPSEFLDTPEKKKAFEEFTYDVFGGNEWARKAFGMADAGRNAGLGGRLSPGSAAAPGYRIFEGVEADPMGGGHTVGLGYELTKKLGVDAVLVVTTDCPYYKDRVYISRASMDLYGPNPIPLSDEDAVWSKGGFRGQLYSGAVTSDSVFKNVSILPPEDQDLKGLNDEGNYVGFTKVVDAMANKIATHVHKLSTEE